MHLRVAFALRARVALRCRVLHLGAWQSEFVMQVVKRLVVERSLARGVVRVALRNEEHHALTRAREQHAIRIALVLLRVELVDLRPLTAAE